jgi:SnoaL-like domain
MAQAAVPARGTSQIHTGWLGIGALVVVVALLAGLGGYFLGNRAATTTSPDQALIDDLTAAWSTTYDPGKVAGVYAANAVMHDAIAGETSTGLEAIQAKVSEYAGYGFRTVTTSTPVRQGEYVIGFMRYGTDPGSMLSAISVAQVKDGKIVNHWVYPAE